MFVWAMYLVILLPRLLLLLLLHPLRNKSSAVIELASAAVCDVICL
jgi:hypothetical protein